MRSRKPPQDDERRNEHGDDDERRDARRRAARSYRARVSPPRRHSLLNLVACPAPIQRGYAVRTDVRRHARGARGSAPRRPGRRGHARGSCACAHADRRHHGRARPIAAAEVASRWRTLGPGLDYGSRPDLVGVNDEAVHGIPASAGCATATSSTRRDRRARRLLRRRVPHRRRRPGALVGRQAVRLGRQACRALTATPPASPLNGIGARSRAIVRRAPLGGIDRLSATGSSAACMESVGADLFDPALPQRSPTAS